MADLRVFQGRLDRKREILTRGRPCRAATWKRPVLVRGEAQAKHGLEGALNKAIEAKTSQGAPRPDKSRLLKELQQEYKRGPR